MVRVYWVMGLVSSTDIQLGIQLQIGSGADVRRGSFRGVSVW